VARVEGKLCGRHQAQRTMPVEAQITFLFVVLGAYFTGTALGFGTSIICVTFAAQLMPLDVLLPIIAPLNVALSLYIAIRYRAETQWRYLIRRVVPLVALGIPVGMVLFNLRELTWLRLVFGIFVILLAALQLRLTMGRAREVQVLRPRLRTPLLISGGLMHGLFTTGGPLIVYVMGREIEDKAAFRSTIATMFVPMTTALIVDYALLGLFDAQTFRTTAMAVPPYLLGLWLGEIAHHRVDNARFKLGLWLLLLAGGFILAVRALLATI
jgi:uncharacterized protein